MIYGWGKALKTIKFVVPGLGAVFKFGDVCITVGQLCPQTANTV